MNLATVVDILKVGLAGLVFLLMFLSYRLLAAEQARPAPRSAMLSSARRFAWICVLLISLVAGSTLFERVYLSSGESAGSAKLESCRQSLLRLQTLSAQEESNVASLRTLIANHVAACEPAFER